LTRPLWLANPYRSLPRGSLLCLASGRNSLAKKKKATAKVRAEKKTRNFLFNTIHAQIEQLDMVMCSSDAENLYTNDMILIASLLKPIASYTTFLAAGNNEKKTPRVAARRKG
jgi:hypothetical protein